MGKALVVWGAILALTTLGLWVFRDSLREAHLALALLLVVLGASARNGRRVGFAVATVSFLALNFFLLPPYYTFRLEDPLGWTVLFAFLVTGGVAAQLFHGGQAARATAERRAHEAERFAEIAATSAAAPTATDALRAIADLARRELPVRTVQLFGVVEGTGETALVAQEPVTESPEVDAGLLQFVLRERRLVTLETNGTTHVPEEGARLGAVLDGPRTHATVLMPLHVMNRTVGVMCLSEPRGLALDEVEASFAEGLARHAALALERLRLVRESETVAGLREADRLKDAFVASVSHDLRTPLTSIRALAAEIRETGDERAGIIEEEAERLNRLVTDLLDLSRVRAGALPLDLQVIAGEDLVGAALQRLGGVPGHERIVVRLPSDGTLPVGRMDFVQALRALANLLENALRYAPGEEPIELVVQIEGPHLAFRVLDRGPGLPDSDREKVFQPFFRGSSGMRRSGGGTGLGLTIARSLAEAQGGSLEYEPRDGGGSAFILRVPAESIPELS
ncbi:MAG: ATP-binding protein [Longimicrobiales bacterium]